MTNLFLNLNRPVEKRKHRLPHWQQGGAYIFVTWRLKGSIPLKKWLGLKMEREAWLAAHQKPWTKAENDEFHVRFSGKVEDWLDRGLGECYLRDPAAAKVVAETLHHFDGVYYDLASFVIMPNHVHVLFKPNGERPLWETIKSWKGYSANEINKMLKRSGSFWQRGYWDRLLRSPTHFLRCQEYIRQNPVKARLIEGEYVHFEK